MKTSKRKPLSILILIIIALIAYSCIPVNQQAQSSPELQLTVTATNIPSPTPTKEIDPYLENLTSLNIPVAEQVEYQFEQGISSDQKQVVIATINFAYDFVSRYVDDQPIPVVVYAYRNCDSLQAAYADYLASSETHNKGADSFDPCSKTGFAQPSAIFILISPDSVLDLELKYLSRLLFHEYFHIVQGVLDNNYILGDCSRSHRCPPWLMEGSAEYFKLLLYSNFESAESEEEWQSRENYLRTSNTPVSQIGDSYSSADAYILGSLMVRHLVQEFGFDKLMEVFSYSNENDLNIIFSKVYGKGLEEIFNSFEDFRNTSFPYVTATPTLASDGTARISGQILSADGSPMEGVTVQVEGEFDLFLIQKTVTDSNGNFSLIVSPGGYYLGIILGEEFYSGFYVPGKPGNFTVVQLEWEAFRVKEGETFLVELFVPIDLPERQDLLTGDYPCGVKYPEDDGNHYTISGNLSTASGDPANGYYVLACTTEACVRPRGDVVNGEFSINAPNGIYLLLVFDSSAEEELGVFTSEGVFNLPYDKHCSAAVILDGAPVEDLSSVVK